MRKIYCSASWLLESWKRVLKRVFARKCQKLTALALAFLFLFSAISPVFADEALGASPDSHVASSIPETQAASTALVPSMPARLIGSETVGSGISGSASSNDGNTTHPNFETTTDLARASSAAGDVDQTLRPAPTSLTVEPGAPPSAGVASQPAIVKPDLSTGALVYSYPLPLPPGRRGLTPELSLQYNSQKTDNTSIIGFGWELSAPFIVRKNSHGTDNLYSTNDYTSSQYGDLQLLQTSGSLQTFVPQSRSSDFGRYSLNTSTNTWKFESKSGLVFTFGDSRASREDDPANTAHADRWMVSSIADSNGNTISYTYTKDQNKLYPLNINYGIVDVNVSLESRPDIATSYSSAFSVTVASRISEIQVKVLGMLRKKYSCAYIAGDNGMRSLLRSITETGYDAQGSATGRPPMVFDYTAHQGDIFTPSNGQSIPGLSAIGNSGLIVGNINGDAYPDILKAYEWVYVNYFSDKHTYLFDPSTNSYQTSDTYAPPQNIMNYTDSPYNKYDGGVRILDVNGDGKGDLLRTPFDHSGAVVDKEINNGNGWTQIPNTDPTYSVSYTSNPWYTLFSEDLNNDGLVDYIQTSGNVYGFNTRISMNTGSTFSTSSSFSMPVFTGNNQHLMFDINGDNLPDIIESSLYFTQSPPYYYRVQNVYINTGYGWQLDPRYVLPTDFSYFVNGYNGTSNAQVIVADFNNDGLNDLLSVGGYLYLNQGKSFSQAPLSNSMMSVMAGNNNCNCQNPYLPMDLNADGAMDFVFNGYVYYSAATRHTDLLQRVTLPTSGTIEVGYKSSAQYRDSNNNLLNPKLPFIIETVSSVTTTDPVAAVTGTTEYSYEDGFYYVNPASVFDRRFAGFHKVTTVDPDGSKTIVYFHQGNSSNTALGEYDDQASKIGKIYRTEIYGPTGVLYKKTINMWDKYPLTTNAEFVKLIRSTSEAYDGNTTHRDSAEGYTYDNTNGNCTQKVEYGEVTASDDGSFVDISNDKFTTVYSYANAVSGALSQVAAVLTTNQTGSKVKESQYFYDGLPLGQTSLGNLTEQDDWVSGTHYAVTKKSYDGTFGLVKQITDANNHSTNYVYDPNHLYPATISDALSHETSYTYDYSSGQVVQKIDPNSLKTQYKYDGLDRLLEVDQPDMTTPSTLLPKTAYIYNDTLGAVSVQETNYLDATNTVTTYTYFDGLRRRIQQRKTEAGGSYQIRDYIYNNLGMLQKESLPYSGLGSDKTTPTTVSTLYTNYTYDSLHRITTVANAVGTTTNTYANRKTTIVDANGKSKDTFVDAYGNLVEIDEHNQGSIYITAYSYDYLGDLTKIIDAAGNVRMFSYDGLGRRLTAQDIHATTDTLFGTYTFSYDEVGNLLSRLDPNQYTTIYTYDEVNRVLTEGTTKRGRAITYTYDSCTHGIGHLCQAVTPSVTTSYLYNSVGLVASETKTVAITNYTTSYTYDRQGHQSSITNPDNSQVLYTYDAGGLVSGISRKESSDASFTDVVSGITYSATEQPLVTTYANGSITTNAYDSNKLYRLTSKLTTANTPGSSTKKAAVETNLQDLSYAYDSVGNITQIIDNSTTDTKRTVIYGYDDLYRLTSATATNVATGQQGYVEQYSYDALGNILTHTQTIGSNSPITYTYYYEGTLATRYQDHANPHAVTSINDGKATTMYKYDRNGNLQANNTHTFNYIYDYNNRLIESYAGPSLAHNTYSYDHNGQRVTCSSGGTTSLYASKYYNVSGSVTTKHIFANGMVVASVTGTGAGATAHTINTDHLTSSNIVTDASGGLEETEDYYPFGALRLDERSGSYTEQRKFTGYEHDGASGLEYANARYYDAARGKFISLDPSARENPERFLSDPQQLNYYSYARNNPINITDPSGNCIWDGCIGEALIAGAVVGGLVSYFGQPRIANAPALGEQTYRSPSAAEIAVNTGINVYLGELTFGSIAVEREALTSQQRALQATTQERQAAASDGAVVNAPTKALAIQGAPNVELSEHAKTQMLRRGVAQSQVQSTLQDAESFEYFHEGAVKTGYRDSQTGLFVGEVKGTGRITTVITNTSSNYPQNLIVRSQPDYQKGVTIKVH